MLGLRFAPSPAHSVQVAHGYWRYLSRFALAPIERDFGTSGREFTDGFGLHRHSAHLIPTKHHAERND